LKPGFPEYEAGMLTPLFYTYATATVGGSTEVSTLERNEVEEVISLGCESSNQVSYNIVLLLCLYEFNQLRCSVYLALSLTTHSELIKTFPFETFQKPTSLVGSFDLGSHNISSESYVIHFAGNFTVSLITVSHSVR
jgi:hypothetical protein